MKKLEQLYEGKAKKVFATDQPDLVIVDYKDDATALNGKKRGTIKGKGAINNMMTNRLMQMLEKNGVPTHFVEEISDRETVVKKVSIVPLEVIIRNVAAGSLSKRLGIPEGTPLRKPVIEYCYKCDEQMKLIAEYALKVDSVLIRFFKEINVELIDFKLEFGTTSDGTLVLADEISPDTCRFWDATTHEKLDKDRFRRDMGGVEEAYIEMARRLHIEE